MSESKRMSVIGALVTVLAYIYIAPFRNHSVNCGWCQISAPNFALSDICKFGGAVSEMSEQFLLANIRPSVCRLSSVCNVRASY